MSLKMLRQMLHTCYGPIADVMEVHYISWKANRTIMRDAAFEFTYQNTPVRF